MCFLRVKARGQRGGTTFIGSLPSVTAGKWLSAEAGGSGTRNTGFKATTMKAVPPTVRDPKPAGGVVAAGGFHAAAMAGLPGAGGSAEQTGRGDVGSNATLKAGFRDIREERIPAPLKMKSAADCLRFERESFGALHTMLAGLDQPAKEAAWREIENELRKFESSSGFEGPCELSVVAGSA
jgi:hypothetical protein